MSLEIGIEKLRAGEVVAMPTETVYGLAGRIDREETLTRIFQIKQRPFFDPLIVHLPPTWDLKSVAQEISEPLQILIRKFWPGPLTIVTPKTDAISSLITSGLPTVALRVPAHPVAKEILAKLGVPLAAPSANMFGKTSPTLAGHVVKEFGDKVSVVDGGPCEVGLESTVVSADLREGKWVIHILRPGGVGREEIDQTLRESGLKYVVQRSASVASPGHLEHHYQPTSPVVIAPATWSESQILAAFQERTGQKSKCINKIRLSSQPELAARSLYQQMRESSEPDALIVFEYREDFSSPAWEAIWDRVVRSSTVDFCPIT
ncbi:MAG: L-threonylcarbamoyladenylate synthase [Bdellovibrionales bacterium]